MVNINIILTENKINYSNKHFGEYEWKVALVRIQFFNSVLKNNKINIFDADHSLKFAYLRFIYHS
ncbi:hypothetical protein CTM97_04945 [Photobacterium phosphoreum]|uniref:Uncharacterized protein n=1 Tax=Photobacterium phosphoreum TaxID=659 RepID=A0A2T3JW83_PHOPO|nr:hypothetical protein CTM96_03995 [Photobacterium phosphoreum]PSU43362.1 hypothetical protein CTM97_04945 [Photobacterium phosphoreum]PSU53598.1 hypothetical protein C9J18_04095 [Photobacterium phosphoreum]